MKRFNKIELRGKLRAKFEIETGGMFTETKDYLHWLESNEVERQYSAQDINSSNFSDGFIKKIGHCDEDCDAVIWIGNTCKFVNDCKIGCGTVWKL
jgi:hypothetical protein